MCNVGLCCAMLCIYHMAGILPTQLIAEDRWLPHLSICLPKQAITWPIGWHTTIRKPTVHYWRGGLLQQCLVLFSLIQLASVNGNVGQSFRREAGYCTSWTWVAKWILTCLTHHSPLHPSFSFFNHTLLCQWYGDESMPVLTVPVEVSQSMEMLINSSERGWGPTGGGFPPMYGLQHSHPPLARPTTHTQAHLSFSCFVLNHTLLTACRPISHKGVTVSGYHKYLGKFSAVCSHSYFNLKVGAVGIIVSYSWRIKLKHWFTQDIKKLAVFGCE